MAAEYITKESTNKKGEKKLIQYRVDAEFKPKEINDICKEFIENYCVAKNETEWFVNTISKPFVYSKGEKKGYIDEKKDYPFVAVRADFVKKFFPEILKVKEEEEKKPTWKEEMLAKYGKK
jgi:hypothetical protein